MIYKAHVVNNVQAKEAPFIPLSNANMAPRITPSSSQPLTVLEFPFYQLKNFQRNLILCPHNV